MISTILAERNTGCDNYAVAVVYNVDLSCAVDSMAEELVRISLVKGKYGKYAPGHRELMVCFKLGSCRNDSLMRTELGNSLSCVAGLCYRDDSLSAKVICSCTSRVK